MARIPLADIFGLRPFPLRLREMKLAIRGDGITPKTKVGLSSRALIKPRLAFPLWLGRKPEGRLIPIYNLFNHTPPNLREGWSVEKTNVRDFRGGDLTYDSHNGTDFAVPPGTIIAAAAPGVVVRCSNEFHRGGLKVFIDHGRGLITTYNHLAKVDVRVGETVHRGQPIARSGASGIDGFLLFPWSTPHLHLNVWLNGRYVDPFPQAGLASLWQAGDRPLPVEKPSDFAHESYEPTVWDPARVAAQVAACIDPAVQRELAACPDLATQAITVMFQRNYFPFRFTKEVDLYPPKFPREARLSLPFRAEDYDGILL